MIKYILAFLIICLSSCGPRGEYLKDSHGNIETIVIYDGCEYIKNWVYGGCYTLTHKGNCKNPIHIYNKVKKK